ncbi:sugar ABC transporter permease [Ilumatobacter sp.]|uniref:sugar ABC transporter permease n=1 Tax=Ilumatobacter sp. TaxID=1967498 RepID=UPI003C4A5766
MSSTENDAEITPVVEPPVGGQALTDFALDAGPTDLKGALRASIGRIRGGDLGSIPAVLAIIVLVAIFGIARPDSFLSKLNFANFLEQASSIIVIAMAVTFVLLLGEIDLAAGYTAGVAGAVLATRLQNDWPLIPAAAMSMLVALALGVFTGFMVAKVGIPSFVVTLANVLLFQGILLLLVREGGSVRIQSEAINDLVGGALSPGLSWVVAIVGVALFAFSQYRRQRESYGAIPMSLVFLRIGIAIVLIGAITFVLNQNRAFPGAPAEIKGMPIVIPVLAVMVVVLSFVLGRTAYGRHLYAVGGNAEAARRAGINVQRLRLSAFAVTGVIAGIGGWFLASRVNSVDANTGANDTLLLAVGAAVIGGTSLFGGRGRMVNAVLGGLVLALIPNGLGLVGKTTVFGYDIDFSSSGVKFIASGLALLAASSVDALSRKRTT